MDIITGNIGLAILAIVVICAGGFFYDMHKRGVSAPQEAAILLASPQAQTAKADLEIAADLLKQGFASLRAEIAAAMATPNPPVVGQSFSDVWDAAFAVANLPNGVVIDGEMVRSGPQPIVFRTVPAIAPSTKTSVVREA